MFIRVIALLALLLTGGLIYYYLAQRPGGFPIQLPGMTASTSGIEEIAARLPKNTGFLLAVDLRQGTDLAKELQSLRDKLKANPEGLKAIGEAETEMGLKLDDVVKWARPAAFVGILPAAGQSNLWGSASQGVADADNGGRLTGCKSNLKNIATACEMYSTDNAGRYPLRMEKLTPDYLKVIPSCPAGQQVTYQFDSAASPDAYTIYCQGHHHPAESENFPQYNSMEGLKSADSSQARAAATPANLPLLVFGTPVADEPLAQQHLLQMLAKVGRAKPKQESINGSPFWVDGEAVVGIHKGYILGASSRPALDALLASFDGKAENLTAHPTYKMMRKKLPQNQGVVAFLPLEGVAETLSNVPPSKWDEKTKENLRTMLYLAGGATMQGSNLRTDGVLGISPETQASFARALITAPTDPLVSAELVPSEWNYYSAVNVHYLTNVILEGLRLSPEVRPQVDMGLNQARQTGVDLEKGLWEAFTGEVAWTGNYMKKMPGMISANFSKARSQGQLTACKSNLKNLATASEMYSTDNAGRYETSLQQLIPGNYLRSIPTCPSSGKDTYSASFKSSTNPDHYEMACTGHNHGSAGDFPQYNSEQGLLEGDARETEVAADGGQPTTLVLVGVKNLAKAEELLKKLDGMMPFLPGPKVGEVQIFEAAGLSRAMVSKPYPMLLVAYGPDSKQLIQECLEVKNPVSKSPEFQKIHSDHPELWVAQSYIDLKDLLAGLASMLEQAPTNENTAMAKMMLGGLGDLRGVSYAVVEKDAVRLVSDGNASLATGATAVAAAIMVPNFVRARGQGQLTACKSNSKNIATALEMYSTDNAGHYPTSLRPLTPDYLKRIPTCPAAQKETYSESYQVTASPDVFSFYCTGHHHEAAGAEANFPQYNSTQGLIDRP